MPPELADGLTALALVMGAEFGDKSQLVCMSLASRYRPLPVLLGASAAFALLNAVAVVFGAGLDRWLPDWLLAALVAALFCLFGIRVWRAAATLEGEDARPAPRGGVFVSTFALIFLAEFGDKTQLTVAGLASTTGPWPVWLGATAALVLTSLIGVIAGRTLLQRLPFGWIHRLSAVLFFGFALYAGYEAVVAWPT
jgi:putative Ca2+/H+ antiporter (TMEM165/GDT1 family)